MYGTDYYGTTYISVGKPKSLQDIRAEEQAAARAAARRAVARKEAKEAAEKEKAAKAKAVADAAVARRIYQNQKYANNIASEEKLGISWSALIYEDTASITDYMNKHINKMISPENKHKKTFLDYMTTTYLEFIPKKC
jgi:hypothetical protein